MDVFVTVLAAIIAFDVLFMATRFRAALRAVPHARASTDTGGGQRHSIG